jgi:hypothetical protein
MKKILLVALLTISSSTYAADPAPGDVYLFCSGMLLRSSGLINQNINAYSGEAKSQLLQISKHLENNGNILMQKGMSKGGTADSLNMGSSFANKEISNNVLAIIQKGSNQNKSIKEPLIEILHQTKLIQLSVKNT